jgi:hypothetical protein
VGDRDEVVGLRRGILLQALHAQYPYALTRAMLEKAVCALYPALKGMDADIEYLREKGLLTSEETTVAARVYRSYKLTAAGVDVVEGSTTLPGISIERA